jgi:hypothetical protein
MTTRTRGSPSRTRRREGAAERAAQRAKRTPKQQLARLDQFGHTATKERARLRKSSE